MAYADFVIMTDRPPKELPVAQIGIGRTYCQIHDELGKKAWLAKILGVNTTTYFRRSYCTSTITPPKWGEISGTVVFTVQEPGVYEYRGFCLYRDGRYWGWNGFCRLSIGGGSEFLSKGEAFALVARLEDAPLFMNCRDHEISAAAIEMLRGPKQ